MDKIDVDLVTVMTLRYSTFYFLWSLCISKGVRKEEPIKL